MEIIHLDGFLINLDVVLNTKVLLRDRKRYTACAGPGGPVTGQRGTPSRTGPEGTPL